MTLFWILLTLALLVVIGSAGMMKYFDGKHGVVKKKDEDEDEE